MSLARRALLVVLALAGALACGAIAGKGLAEDGVTQFHQRLDTGAYDEIYEAVDEQFRATTTRADFTRILRAVHDKLGKVVSTKQTNFFAQDRAGIGSGSYVSLTYETQFANGRGTESFNWRVDGGKARLVGYNINSVDLISR